MNSARSIRQQQGAVLVLTALSLLVLMGMAGLAIDIGHTLVNKTIEQNAADSAALSAAIRLNKQNDSSTNVDEIAARTQGRATYDLFKAAQGNGEINSGLTANDFNFFFTKTTDLSGSVTWNTAEASLDANFVRVTTNPLNVKAWFGGVVGFPNLSPSSSAVAGFIPIAPCDLAPIMLCADNPTSPDKDCSDGSCYGYKINNVYCLTPSISGGGSVKCAASNNSQWGPGNVGFVDLGDNQNGVFPSLPDGASTLGGCLAGDPQCQNYCEYSPNLTQIPPKSGVDWGPVRFAIEDIFHKDTNSKYGFTSDTITGLSSNGPITNNAGQSSTLTYLDWNKISTTFILSPLQIPITGLDPSNTAQWPASVPNPFTVYRTQTFPSNQETNLASSPAPEYGKRVLNIPFVNCTTPPNGTSGTLPLVGFGCFFLTSLAEKQGSEDFILGQFVDDPSLCVSAGNTTSTGDFGFDKVIEYKDPDGGHS